MTSIQRFTLRISTVLAAAGYTLSSAVVRAQDFLGPVPNIGSGANTDIRVTVLDVLGRVLNFMALVAVVFIVIAGIRLVISQGDDDQKTKAKNTIFYVIIGLVVIILASAIVSFVSDTIAG